MSSLQKLDMELRRRSAPQINVSPTFFRRRRSSSLGLSDIFRRKKYLSPIDINTGSDSQLNLFNEYNKSIVSSESPRIWKVRHRNSLSESLVDSVVFDTVLEHPDVTKVKQSVTDDHRSVRKQPSTYTTCIEKFDTFGLFKDFSVYQFADSISNTDGRNLVIKYFRQTCERNRFIRNSNIRGKTLRRYSDGQALTTMPPTMSSKSQRSRALSLTGTDLNTSYWDLHIPENDSSKFLAASRRNSWSPDLRTFPRFGLLTRSNNSSQLSVQSDVINPGRCSCSNFIETTSVAHGSPIILRKKERNDRFHNARQRSRSFTSDLTTDHSKYLHRSRSADFSNRTKHFRRRRHVSSLVRRIPFSDIEGSDASDDNSSISGATSVASSRRSSQASTIRSSSSIEICSSSDDKDSGYQKTDEGNDDTELPEASYKDPDNIMAEHEVSISDEKDSECMENHEGNSETEILETSFMNGDNKAFEHRACISDDKESDYKKSDEDTNKTEQTETTSNDAEQIAVHHVETDHVNLKSNALGLGKSGTNRDTNLEEKSTFDSGKVNIHAEDDENNETGTIKAKATNDLKRPGLRRIPFDADSVRIKTSSKENRENINGKLEFKSMSVEDLLFCSGRGKSSSGEADDVKDVFEAINKEVDKIENKDKDMMVMFLVGGELKVLKRSGASGHGDRIRSDLPSMTRSDYQHHNGNSDYVVYSGHPPSEIKRPRPKSEIIIGRSQSFAGMAEPSPQKKSAPGAMVLGESFRHHRGATMPTQKPAPVGKGAVGVSFRKSPKIPKVPRPNRALLMFQSVKKGIREFIDATKEDIDDLQSRDLDGTSTAQQLKSAERYLKRLEFHLSKLDELHEFYMVQQQLREGVRTMHKAYVTSPGSQRNTLSNVKYGYKECTQTMCNIEAQLEAMMGTFNCKLKGIAGFARLCPGDVFEVTTRHGTQKWKTKGRIEKTGNQKWDIPEFNFKAVVGDIINIKGVEVRAFKSILLGQKSCETKDLFSANPQLMTVSINVNGSLKLSIVITWNPLDGVDESVSLVETPLRQPGTPRRRPVSVIAINGQHRDQDGFDYERRHSNPPSMQQPRDENFILRTNTSTPHINNISSYHGLDSPHVGSSRVSDHLPEAYHHTQLGPLYSQSVGNIPGGFSSSPALYRETDSHVQHPANQNSVYSSSLTPVMSHLHFPSVSLRGLNGSRDTDSAVSNIEDVVHNLSSALEDYHGQYSELNKLEELVKLAHKLLRKQLRNSSRSSSISVSIEDALEAFDFLDTEEAVDDPQSPPANNTKSTFDDMLCSPESTAKTADSGIESLAQRLSEDTQLGSSLGSSPLPPSLGNEEVDQCLMYHLTYCERLLENLGAFGPLKCREIYALDKLQKQSTIIESLLKQAKTGSQVDLHSVMSSLCDNKSLREFWVKCTDHNSLYISPDKLLLCLEQKFAAVISERHQMDPVKVCQHIITRILDIPDYEAEQGRPYFVITLHQFMLYFNEERGLKHVEEVAEELKLVEKLMSGNSDMVIKAILTLRDSIPTAPCLKVIGMLLVTLDKEVEQCTISYLSLIQKRKENRDRAMVVFVEGLEDRTAEIRAGACAALAILEATESIDQLVYLWQSDTSQLVQNKAKEALQSMGDEGKRAFEEAQLSRHGFQGVQVHKGTFM